MIIRTMHFEESMLRMDDRTAVDLKYTTPDGTERECKINAKYRYFIIFHCYEHQSFTAVPVFTYGKIGLQGHTSQKRLGYVPIDHIYENPATRAQGIPQCNRVSLGRLFTEEMAKPQNEPYPIPAAPEAARIIIVCLAVLYLNTYPKVHKRRPSALIF